MQKTEHKKSFALLVFSLIFLVNPNISVIDPLPDFIACYILSRILLRAADTSPYFEEARLAIKRLGWLSFAKIAALFIIAIARGINTSDYDIVALFSLVFAVGEIIISISAVKYLFQALFYLGERSDKTSLISKFSVFGKRKTDPEVLQGLTYLFAVVKCVCYALPYMLLLTRDPDSTAPSVARFYPLALLLTVLLVLLIGTVWLVGAIKYSALTVGSGDFDAALDGMMSEETKYSFDKKRKVRAQRGVTALFAIASVFSLRIAFENYRSINLVPNLLIGVALFILAARLGNEKWAKRLKLSSLIFSACSLAAYLFEIRFLRRFEYFELMSSKEAVSFYLPVEICGSIEFIAHTVMLVCLAGALRSFILANTGIPVESEKYRESDRAYHKSLTVRTFVMVGLGILSGATRFLSIFINSEVQLLQLNPNDFSAEAIPAPLFPWFGLLTLATAVAYIAYSFYHASYIRDEIRAKYEFE